MTVNQTIEHMLDLLSRGLGDAEVVAGFRHIGEWANGIKRIGIAQIASNKRKREIVVLDMEEENYRSNNKHIKVIWL